MKNESKKTYESLSATVVQVKPERCLAVSNLSFKYGNLELQEWAPDADIDYSNLEGDSSFWLP